MYESFYNLSAKPFALSPDPSFYYGSKEHNRVLAYLRYGLNQGEGFVVVTGDVGAGKTTLVGTLLSEITANTNIIASQLVTTQLGPDDLLRMVAASFRLVHEGVAKATLLKNIETFLRQQERYNKRVLLIIDEAQNLGPHSLEELRMLSNFMVGNKSLLQSFLLGQAEFRDTLAGDNLEQFRQRVIASYHLGPLGADETRGYVEHRMKVVGWKDDPEFSDDAYEAIYKYTHGVPRRINTLCDRVLLYSYLEELHQISGETVNEVTKELGEESAINLVGTRVANSDAIGAGTFSSKNVTELQGHHHRNVSRGTGASGNTGTLEERVRYLEDVIEKARDLLKVLLR